MNKAGKSHTFDLHWTGHRSQIINNGETFFIMKGRKKICPFKSECDTTLPSVATAWRKPWYPCRSPHPSLFSCPSVLPLEAQHVMNKIEQNTKSLTERRRGQLNSGNPAEFRHNARLEGDTFWGHKRLLFTLHQTRPFQNAPHFSL